MSKTIRPSPKRPSAEQCSSVLIICITILLIQINRFSVSNLHGRPRKNNHPFGIYENVKLGLINYTLLGIIEHHGLSLTLAIMSVTSDKITSGTIVMKTHCQDQGYL